MAKRKKRTKVTVRPMSDKLGRCGHKPTLSDYDRKSYGRAIPDVLHVDPSVLGLRLSYPVKG